MYSTRFERKRRLISEINIVPYIDVMLVLLVIFMITAPMLTQGVKVELPQAKAEIVETPDNLDPVLVNIDAQGQYYIDIGNTKEQPITSDDLFNKISIVLNHQPNTPVFVGGDRRVSYGKVVKLMALLQQAGATHVGLVTESPL
ncbi:protein TolR [Candidatus Nitrosacidococcus tergens]|uniref:Tol-Pal system protein TolR n=1 Tax=Candidatus Nitrosacidococcus tergens TaxID=553981 RepID=A0A7G1QBT5_9GAMM|nr:protein TolR [Candidatus Nitrosacidococcus tergens]CAB1277451.1 Protein TolR [Candidatus Nitrosacidococcus tergens]